MNKEQVQEKKKEHVQQPVCCCMEVYESEIVEIIHKYGITDLETLQKYTDAGQGCKSCTFDLEDIIRRENPKVKVVRPK